MAGAVIPAPARPRRQAATTRARRRSPWPIRPKPRPARWLRHTRNAVEGDAVDAPVVAARPADADLIKRIIRGETEIADPAIDRGRSVQHLPARAIEADRQQGVQTAFHACEKEAEAV